MIPTRRATFCAPPDDTCVNFLEFRHRHPRVLHGRLMILVSEHLGDVTHVSAGVEHQSRGCVAKQVTAASLRARPRVDIRTDKSGQYVTRER